MSSSSLGRSAQGTRPVHRTKSRTHVVVPRAFLKSHEISKAAMCVPSPFIQTLQGSACPSGLLSSQTKYYGSHFGNDLFPKTCQGEVGFEVGMERWRSMYELRKEQHLVLCDEQSHDAFLFFVSDVVNKGAFGTSSPTGKRSQVMGLQRVHLSSAGEVTDVWLFRSGTEEEHQLLLKHSGSAPQQLRSSQPASPALVLDPCTWSTDHIYAATIASHASVWNQEVMSQGSLSALSRIASPDITLLDGTGLLHAPLTGTAAVGCSLAEQFSRCELESRVLAAQVMEPGGNKICQHWTQLHTCRARGVQMRRSGASLLVFDSKARLQQVVEFVGLDNPYLGFFDEEAVARVLACYQEGDSTVQVAAQRRAEERARAEAQRLKEEAECLARQDREWSSW